MGVGVLFSYLRRRNEAPAAKALSAQDNQKMDALLAMVDKHDKGGDHG